MTTTKTKMEIITETGNHFKLSNRSVNCNGCAYEDSEGNSCGVGRCFTDEAKQKLSKLCFNSMSTYHLSNEMDIEPLFKEEYKGHSLEFWGDIQQLHDCQGYWNETGLSPSGLKRVSHLIRMYRRLERTTNLEI